MNNNHPVLTKAGAMLNRRELLAGGTALVATITFPLSISANGTTFALASAARKNQSAKEN